MTLFPNGDAILSNCGKYRWLLTRVWDKSKPLCAWIMLNPSTADASADDPTVRKCSTFSQSWGFGGLLITNLFGYRAKDPGQLSAPGVDPVGESDRWIEKAFANEHVGRIVVAWGSHDIVSRTQRHVLVRRLSVEHKSMLYCLARNADGHPRHPLYIKNSTQPLVWFDPRHVEGGK